MPNTTTRRQTRLTLLICGLTIVLLAWGWTHETAARSLLATLRDVQAERDFLQRLGPAAGLGSAGLMLVAAVIPGAPTGAIALLNGTILGHVYGFAASFAGLTLGNLLQVALLRRAHKHHTTRGIAGTVVHWLTARRHPEWPLLLGYAIPLIPTAFVNLAAARVSLTPWARTWPCLFGSVVAALIYTFAAQLLVLHANWRILVLLIALAALVALAELDIRWYRRHGRLE